MDGSWECELDEADFNFLVNGRNEDSIMWEDVRVFRKGKKEEVLAREAMTAEDLINEEAEISRKKREALEKQGGRLRRPVSDAEYNPKQPPKG